MYARPPVGVLPPPGSRHIPPPYKIFAPAPGSKTALAAKALAEAPLGSLPKDISSAVAYERKKQRAKDARVKLNEAIEELAVAIDLAGSQSKERYDHLTNTISAEKPHASTDSYNAMATMMEETMKEASEAKKWDRPSFVGLSATIIKSLNSQCEALMTELFQLKKVHEEMKIEKSSTSGVGGSVRLESRTASPAAHSQSNASQTNKLDR